MARVFSFVSALAVASIAASTVYSTLCAQLEGRAADPAQDFVFLPYGNTRRTELGGAVVEDLDDHLTSHAERQALQMSCQQDVQQFVQDNQAMVRSRGEGGPVEPNPEDMLFFLHVPRTAGRTFFSCFLKQAIPPSKRCAKSYDVLRLNVSIADCGLLSSHDDYSATKFFPDTAAVITQVRDPVDRVLSAYEFSIEVASRELRRPPNAPKPAADKVNTRNVWPWSLLVPWMEADMRARLRKARDERPAAGSGPAKTWVQLQDPESNKLYYHNHLKNQSVWSLAPDDGVVVPSLDPYDNPLTMPLREFIEHPLVRNTIHNGATLQLLGLTNYSHLETASKLRSCISGLPNVKEAMTKAALARLQTLFHVGVTDRLEDSVASAASALGLSLVGPSWRGKADAAFSYEDESKSENEGADAIEADKAANKMAWEVRIADIAVILESKETELRRAKAGIRTAQFKAQTHGGNQERRKAQEELARYTARSHGLQSEIEALRQETAELQVLVVKLKTPSPKMHHSAARIVKDDATFRNGYNLTTAYHRCVASSRAKNANRWKPLTALSTLDGRTFAYSSLARKHISPAVLARIRHLNSMDVRLHELAGTLLERSLDNQTGTGARQVLKPPPKSVQAGLGPPVPGIPREGESSSSAAKYGEAAPAAAAAGTTGTSHTSGAPIATDGAPRAAHHVGQAVDPAARGSSNPSSLEGKIEGLNRAPQGPKHNKSRRRSKTTAQNRDEL
mmetsp:Transcript_21789/g.54868  ORF Transcript_21789/g.54868 Transcript_21789/m.54868 type:complete len:736 (+) Transcript_21789:344-2551(+)